MPKMKSCKSIAKRVRVTKSGKVKRFGMGKRHMLSSKNGNWRRKKRLGTFINKVDEKKIRTALANYR
jgi:large subunit ribosomal protein L35